MCSILPRGASAQRHQEQIVVPAEEHLHDAVFELGELLPLAVRTRAR